MPISRKRKGSEDAEDDISIKKRSKNSSKPDKETDDDGNPYWMLSGKRRLQISEFKGMTMVNIREYYEKDGKTLPGKAGINLPLDQFKTFLNLLPQVLDALEEKGVEVELPKFMGGKPNTKGVDEDSDEEEEVQKPKSKKSNIEATSDEEEDEDD